jgi:predicted Zn-dependent protease
MTTAMRRIVLVGALLVAACTRTPYTGRVQTLGIDENEALERADRAAAQYRLSIRPVTDRATVERVDRVSSRLVDAARTGPAAARVARLSWEFVVADGAETTVAVLENGKIFLGAALVRMAATDDELAGPIGHAVAEVILRHPSERVRPSFVPSAVAETLGVGGGSETRNKLEAEQTDEADWVGLLLATQAGYDPELVLHMFDRLGESARAARLRTRLPELRAEQATIDAHRGTR